MPRFNIFYLVKDVSRSPGSPSLKLKFFVRYLGLHGGKDFRQDTQTTLWNAGNFQPQKKTLVPLDHT